VDAVVDDDPSYYGKVLELLAAANVPLAGVVLTDLCRASFVAIRDGRADSRQQVLIDHAARFNRYVVANATWHQRRLDAFGGTVIVALGHLAMRGVLHLLDGGEADDNSWLGTGTSPEFATRKRAQRELRILRVPHRRARQGRPVDGAGRLRALLDGNPVGAADTAARERVGVRRADPIGPASPGSEALWREALREATPLEAATLLARDPRSPELTATLLDRVTAERVVAIANAMFNPCRSPRASRRGGTRPRGTSRSFRIPLDDAEEEVECGEAPSRRPARSTSSGMLGCRRWE